MNTTLKTLLIAAALVLPLTAHAGHHEQGEAMGGMKMCEPGGHCPMMEKMNGMMERMHKMMSMPCDDAMKKDMGDMMKNMQEMHEHMGQMMGSKGMMMQAPSDADEEDDNHEAHH